MNYSVALRIKGGSIDQDALTRLIGLMPKYSRFKGQDIFNRDGCRVAVCREDFCSYQLPNSDLCEEGLSASLAKFFSRLEKSEKLLNELSMTGTRYDLYVVLFGKTRMIEKLEVPVLAVLGKFNISLVLTAVFDDEIPN